MYLIAADNIISQITKSLMGSMGDTFVYYLYLAYLNSKPFIVAAGFISVILATFVLIVVRREKEVRQKAIVFGYIIAPILCFSLYYGCAILLTVFAPITR